MEGLTVVCILLVLTVSSSHSIGALFLYKTNRNLPDNIELFSLSLSSIMFYVISIIHIILIDYDPLFFLKIGLILESLFHPIVLQTHMAMILLTVQRFFAVRLHLRYESSWIFLNRTRIILSFWLVGCIWFLTFLTCVLTQKFDFHAWNTFKMIYSAFFLFAVNVTFFAAYIYIYVKFRRADQETRSSLYDRRNKAKFFTPFIVCGSFFVFGTLPYSFYNLITDVRYVYLGTYLDGIANSVVYIFLNERVVNRMQRWKNNAVDVV